MSAQANGLTSKVFGLVRHWFGKPAERQVTPSPARPPAQLPGSSPGGPRPRQSHQSQPARPESAATSGSGCALELPLQTILGQLPPELQNRVATGVADVTVSLPLESIVPQLAHGLVKISFGELRNLAPGVFTGGSDRDHVLVQLPLSEILPRIDPKLLRRRPAQKKLDLPAEIESPFSEKGRGLIFSVGPAADAGVTAPKPPVGQTMPPVARPPAPVGGRPAASVPVSPSLHLPPSQRSIGQASQAGVPPVGPGQEPVVAPKPVPPAAPAGASATRAPIRVNVPVSHLSAKRLVPPADANGNVLVVPLRELAAGWPEAFQQQMVAGKFDRVIAALPMDFVEAGLRQGRVACTWKELRACLLPAQPAETLSTHDETVLELPLKVLAPLFLAKQQSARAKKKVSFDTEIPDLFFGAGSAEAAALSAVPEAPVGAPIPISTPKPAVPPPPKPAETNYYIWRDDADAPIEPEPVFKKGPSSPGTDFLRRYATPNEIVSRAAALDGVAGALISLPDGLLVASRVPPELNADTLAAFLPQIFARVAQCTRELKMGEVNNLSFTVGNVPWKIFKVGAIFFAAFGRAGEALPTADLVGLAGELDRKAR